MRLQIPPLPENKLIRYAAIGCVMTLLLVLLTLCSIGEEKPIIEKTSVAAVEKPLPPAPPNVENSQLILELFSPSDASLTEQRLTASTTQQIEQTLTASFVLTKCLIISQDDYRNAYRALVIFAERSKLAADMASADIAVREIAQSASASYAMVYSRVACDDPKLGDLAKQLATWTDTVLKQQ